MAAVNQPRDGATALLRVRLQPRAGANAIVGVKDSIVRVRVTAPPVGGAANEALTRLLARTLRIGRSRILVVRGRTSRTKVVRIDGLTDEEAMARLAAAC